MCADMYMIRKKEIPIMVLIQGLRLKIFRKTGFVPNAGQGKMNFPKNKSIYSSQNK